MSDAPIVLFDGHCTLCSRSVQFILKRERRPVLRFAPLQSDAAQRLLRERNAETDADDVSTVVLIEGDRLLRRSDAALALAGYLRAPWRWARVFRFVPRLLRDAVYRLIARHRYRWFGRTEQCFMPPADWAQRVLE